VLQLRRRGYRQARPRLGQRIAYLTTQSLTRTAAPLSATLPDARKAVADARGRSYINYDG